MPTIEKRIDKNNNVSYRVKIRLKGFPCQTCTFYSLTKAKDWANRTEIKIKDGKYFQELQSKQHTLAEAIDKYINIYLPNLKPKVAYNWTRQLNWWKNQIGKYTLFDITPSFLAEYREKLKSRAGNQGRVSLTNATINRYMGVLQVVMSLAYKEWGWINSNPFAQFKKLKENTERVRFLSDDERRALLLECKNANNPYLYPVVVLALSTGARKMEIMTLKWENVDIPNHRAVLNDTKNGERRSIPLVCDSLKVVQNLYDTRTSNIWLFPANDNSKPFDITRSWKKAVLNAGIKDFRFHDLRHSAASYLAMNGATPAEIADVLGHKTLQMVKRYAHLSDSHKQSVVESMNKKIFL